MKEKSKIKEIKKMKKTLKLLTIILLIATTILASQNSKITGRVIDGKTGDALMGANVILEGIGLGGATDMDGTFRIYKISPGEYNLKASYIGYQTKKVLNISVTAGKTTNLDIVLDPVSLEMSTVVVEVEAKKTGSTYLLAKQKNSVNVQDGISSDQISKNGDSDAADAAKRIVGLSITDDNSIVIRGLSGRYTQTEVNSVPMPSPNADKSDIPLNLFPSTLLESITVKKTYTPDMPGTFAGGNINIKIKAYPDFRVFKTSFSLNQKSNIIQNNKFLTMGSNNNFLGFDNIRQMPDIIPHDIKLSEWNSELGTDPIKRKVFLGNVGKAFNTSFTPDQKTTTQPFSAGVSLGNRYELSKNFEWGFFINSTFSNGYSYKVEEYNKYSVTNAGFEQRIGFYNERSSYNTNLASTISTGIKLYNNHKISLHYIYTHNSEEKFQIGRGFADQFDNGIFLKSFYAEKQINNITFHGDHNFENFLNSKIEWSYTRGNSRLYQPDERGINLRRKDSNNNDSYLQMDIYSWSAGTRKYTNGHDNNKNFDFKYSIYVKDQFGDKYKINIGTRIQSKDRAFSSRNFYHKYASEWSSTAIPSSITVFDNENTIGSTFVDSNYFSMDQNGNVNPGLIMVEDTKGSDAYEAFENINAGYFMIDMPLSFGLFEKIRNIHLITGVRKENYKLQLNPFDPVTKDKFVSNITGDTLSSKINESKYLPSINLIGKFKNNFNIRASYSKTVTRAEFREIAPLEYQAFYGGDVLVGYPELKTTDIYNYDLRFEWYRKADEILAINFFKKDFDNPIEVSLIETSGKIYKTYQNAKSADNRGIEFDSRFGLDFIPTTLGKLVGSFNFSWIQTKVSVSDSISMFTGIVVENEATSKNRALQGQSNAVINAGLYFNNLKGLNASLSYNFFSKRIATLGVGGLPDEYEFPYHSLNITGSQKWNNLKFSMKIKNLLDSKMKFGIENKENNEIKYTRIFSPGLSFSFGVTYDL